MRFITNLIIALVVAFTAIQCDDSITNNNPADVDSKDDATDKVDPEGSTSSAFVSAENGDFTVEGRAFQFSGSNAYHLPNYEKMNPSVVEKTLDQFQEAGVEVVRIWGFYDGYPQYDNDITLQPEAGSYSEENLRHLDNLIAKGKDHDIRFVIAFVNYWDQLGGISQYNKWDGNPEGGMSHFINDPDTQKWYKDYIKMLLNRENTVTGKKYKNEPAVFSWEIMNEGRLPEGDPSELRDWYQEIAQYIKSIDSNHMVATGEEGFDHQVPEEYSVDQYSTSYPLEANKGTSYKMNTAIPEIDYGGAHWYPSEWGYGEDVNEDMMAAQKAWVKDHADIAENQNKPFLIGEYGFPGWGDQRVEKFYTNFWDEAENINLDGSLIWQLTPGSDKCYEYGGNICFPGGRGDNALYDGFTGHIKAMNGN